MEIVHFRHMCLLLGVLFSSNSISIKISQIPNPRQNIVLDEDNVKPQQVPNGFHRMMYYIESEMKYTKV